MGKKIVNATIALSGLSIFAGLIALCLPMHSLWFFVGPVPFFKVETHALSVEVTCTLPFCGELADSASLEDFAQRSCAPTIQQVVDNLCDGAHHAYMVGLMLAIVFCMNVMLQGAAVYSFNYYMTSSMRKKYRKLGVILQCIGIFFVVAVLGIYYAMVIIYLSGVKLKPLACVLPLLIHHYAYVVLPFACALALRSAAVARSFVQDGPRSVPARSGLRRKSRI
ncbi:unnamed protein product [Prorocentrum cordatum]|uniref:Transmembrane protein 107 n=1 Tax=Prorocentrum cordatum TaxID=2364126 RepID=A0ABN9PYI4_9DINO|nr:unnamed protein product [Polarella glacialis]